MSIGIIVRLQIEWTHYWKDCDIEEVMFLKNEHRHIFYIDCAKEVNHWDRDIEIIQLKRKIDKYLRYKYWTPCKFEWMSCEMIAQELLKEFDLNYCEVLEDNENWAYITK